MKTKLVMVVAAVAVALGAWADTEYANGYTWSYQINNGTAEICNKVYNTDGSTLIGVAISPSPTGVVTIPATLGGKPVTSIDWNAFYNCSEMTSLTIPGGVTHIGTGPLRGPFESCSGLTSVTISNGVASVWDGVFSGCSGLKSVTIPSSVTSIGGAAFFGCSGLTSMMIPEGVTSIGSRAFSGCSDLTSVNVPNGVTNIGEGAFDGTPFYDNQPNGLVILGKVAYMMKGRCPANVTIPDGVISIGGQAFENCGDLIDVTIPNSVISIGDSAFEGCDGLTSVVIPGSVMSIGEEAFHDCSGLRVLSIGNGVTSVGDSAFEECGGLMSVELPDSVTSIGEGAFRWCESLTSVTIPGSVTNIGFEAFERCSGLMNVVINNGMTCIWDSMFPNCTSLTNVLIPASVTRIGYYAFAGCSSLTSVTIPNSVANIEGLAFSCCGLMSVVIPSSVTNIGECAFEGCNSLEKVIFSGGPPNARCDPRSDPHHWLVFASCPDDAVGYYPSEYASQWRDVLDSDGKWQGLTMRENSDDDSGGGDGSGGSGSGSDGGSGGASGGDSGSGTGSDSEDVQGEWYASLSDKREATSVSVGGETWNTSKQLPYRFSCGAVLTSTVGGKRLDLNNVTVPTSGIYADGDLAILLTGDNYVSGHIDHGVKYGSYLIFGLGTLTVRNSDLYSAIEGTDVSICAGASVTIYQEDDYGAAISARKTLISMSMLTIHSIDTEGMGISSREVNILGSLVAIYCRARGIAGYEGTVVIDGSVVNICMDGNYASNYFKTFSCTHSYFSFVNNTGSALNADEVWFENSLAKLYSNSSYALNAGNVTFGEGDYYVVSGRKSEYGSALDASTILIDGGDVQVCSPFDQYAVAVNVTDFQMDAGSFEIVDKVDIRPFLEYDAAAAAVYTGVLAVGGADVAPFMSSFYSDVILDAISNGKLNDVSGTADYGIKCSTYTQTGGTVWMPSSVRGVHSYQTPVVNGGSYNNSFYGYSWDYESGTYAMVNPVGTAGGEEEELACFSYQIAGAKKRDKVSQSWTGVLPSYYGTGSLYADEEGILYFWLPKDWSLSDEGSDNDDPVSPVPEDAVTVTPTPDPVMPGYEVLKEKDITAPYEAPKAVTLQGVVYDGGGAVVGVVELKLGKVNAKKKTSKVSGSFTGLDGKKITIKGVNVAGIDGTAPVTVSLDVKGHGTMTVTIGGTQFAGSLGGWHVQSGTVGGNWSKAGAKVYVDVGGGRGATALPAGTIKGLLPDGEPVVPKFGKWSFARAASVKWTKPKKDAARPEIYDEESGKGLIVDDTGGKTNLSGMKLTYTPKTGVFKGSFKIYALEGSGKATKLKKYTVNVTGVVVDGVGHGEATCKRPAAGPWTVTVE